MARNYPNLRVRALKFLGDKVAELGAEPHPVDAYLSAAMRIFGGNGELATFTKNYAHTLRKTLSLGDYGMLKDEAPKQPATGGGVFAEQVEEAKGMLSQPNARVCQSACIAMATGRSDIMSIRQELEAIGEPGDPAVMGKVLHKKFGDRYIFDENACLSEIREWLKAGEFLITHGWFTPSGHVICLDGIEIDSETLGYKISVKDPWSEFDGPSWSYNKQVDRYDGYYSARLLYASIVAGQSCQDASAIYRSGKMDSMHKGAWVHRILPAKKPSPSAEAHQPVGGSEIPEVAINLIKEFEGCRLKAYDDGVGVMTIGWGTIKYPNGSAVKDGDVITQQEADDFFRIQLKGYWDNLKPTPFWDEMSGNQKAALLSFSYNTGWNYRDKGFDTLNFVIEGKHWGDVPAALMRYINPGTSTEAGLRRRRKAEGELWLTP